MVEQHQTLMSGDLHIRRGRARQQRLHDGQPAQQLLDGGLDQRRIIADHRELVRVSQQGQGAQAEHVRGRLMPGQQQQFRDADQLIGTEIVAVLAHQHAEHVLPWVRLRAGHQACHVGAAFPLRRDALLHRQGGVQQAQIIAIASAYTAPISQWLSGNASAWDRVMRNLDPTERATVIAALRAYEAALEQASDQERTEMSR